jgi:hypothetical protein
MAYDGSGNFLRILNWVNDATAGINIRADRHDQQDNDYAAGLSNALCKDGQSQPTNDLPLNNHRLINVGDPVADQDAVNKRSLATLVSTFNTGLTMAGADANGRVTFSSATGVNGLAFTGADLAWLARLATAAGPGTPPVPPATLNRLVLNTKPDGSGTDVVTINDNGTIVANGAITAGSILYAKAAAGNVHLWLQGPAGEDRMVLYTNSAAAASTFLRVTGTQSFEFNTSGQFKAPGALYAAAALLNTDGNVSGTVWDQWGAHDCFSAISARIEARATAWANSQVSQLQYRKVSQGSVPASGSGAGTTIVPAGTVVTGMQTSNYSPVALYYKSLQVFDPVRGWVGFSEQ